MERTKDIMKGLAVSVSIGLLILGYAFAADALAKNQRQAPTEACHCEIGGGECQCAPCTCGDDEATQLVVQQGRRGPGLDPVEQSRLRDRETIAMHERRIRELERRIVELQRIVFRNPAIPMPRYSDPLPPLPDSLFPFGDGPVNWSERSSEAGPIGESPPAEDGEIYEAPGKDDQ